MILFMKGIDFIWLFVSLKAVFKFAILSIFLLLIFLTSNYVKIILFKNFLKGFIVSILIQIFFSLLQLIAWYSQRIELNKVIFNNFLRIEIGHRWTNFLFYPIFRTTGLHWDPAYLGIWTLIGIAWIYFFWKNNWFKRIVLLFSFLVFFMTFSRTAFFALSMLLLITFFISLIKLIYKMKISLNLNNKLKTIFSLLLIISIVMSMSLFIIKGSENAIKIFAERIDVESIGTQRHLNYFTQGWNAISNNFLTLFFGFGYRNGGRGFLSDSKIIYNLPGIENFKAPWSPESDFINSYLELGIIGFVFYLSIFIFGLTYLINIKNRAIKAKNNELINIYSYIDINKKISFFLICYGLLFFAGFFYSFKDSLWYWLLIFSVFLIDLELKDKLVKKYENSN